MNVNENSKLPRQPTLRRWQDRASLHGSWQRNFFFSFKTWDFELLLLISINICHDLFAHLVLIVFYFSSYHRIENIVVHYLIFNFFMLKIHLLLSCPVDGPEELDRKLSLIEIKKMSQRSYFTKETIWRTQGVTYSMNPELSKNHLAVTLYFIKWTFVCCAGWWHPQNRCKQLWFCFTFFFLENMYH